MRRLRSALSLFAPMVRNDSDFARLRQELRWFTGQLGEARNLDVFLKRLEPDAAERPRLQAARDAHYGEIIKVLDSKRFRTLILDLLQWLLTGDWRTKRRAGKPLLAFTSKRIDRLWQDIELRGRDLARLEEEPRHRLRIDIKKIRYALEFVAGLHSGAERRQVRAGKALEELQEALGRLNDLATARLLAAEHQVPADRAQAESEEQDLESAEQIRVAAKAFAKLRKAGPYWRADLADQ
jgi:CHAD domain-containing protein